MTTSLVRWFSSNLPQKNMTIFGKNKLVEVFQQSIIHNLTFSDDQVYVGKLLFGLSRPDYVYYSLLNSEMYTV